MNKVSANFIELIGINFFKVINRKKSDKEAFKDCTDLNHNDIKSKYSKVKIFDKCESYNKPSLINSKYLSNVKVDTYKMRSKYDPIDDFKTLYRLFEENKNIYFEEIKSKNNSKNQNTCFIYLHGFSERNYNNEIKHVFNKANKDLPEVNFITVHLPYHMRRSPKNQPYSGAYLFDSYPIVTIEGIRQAVQDVSQVLSYAKERYEKVIVGGFSLGGHVTAYLGTCDDRADLYIMGQCGTSLPNTIKHLTPCPGIISKRNKWEKEGIDFESLYSPIELSNYSSIIEPEKVVSIGGVYDKLIKFKKVERLRRLFNSVQNINYYSGHIGFLFEIKKVKEELLKIIYSEVIRGE